MTEPVRLMKPGDLAERWQVKTSQIYALSREGLIPTVRVGRYYRYRLDLIEEFERRELEDEES